MSTKGDVTGLRNAGKALEDSFFARENERLLDELRKECAREDRKQALRSAVKVQNEEVLDSLVDLDLEPESMVAFGLVPLVEVAWADGEMDDKERKALLKAAADSGVEVGSATYSLLESWLKMPPDPQLLDTWKGYVEAVASSLSPEARAELKNGVMGRALAVAEAAGGFLGMAKISKHEQAMLDELEWAFE